MTGGIPCLLMRGGTSKGAYFLSDDLPADPAERDDLLLRVMGAPDPRQIDGIGGAHPLTSKVAVVGRSAVPGVDVDYLFLQVGVDQATVTDAQNCGNILAGVGPYAVERGLVPAISPDASTASVRIRMLNTDSIAVAWFAVADGRPVYTGDTEIAGVPGTAGPIRIDFEGTVGSTCGSLLPTGRAVDVVDGIEVTCIDNGMPVIVLRAADAGVSGYESCADLEANAVLRDLLESIRLQMGPRMGLGDVRQLTVPKLTMVAAARAGGHLCTRTFIPHRCHDAIGVLGAVSVATAALIAGTPAASALSRPVVDGAVVVEHPTGTFDVALELDSTGGSDEPEVRRAGIVRTARPLFDGVVLPRERR